MQRILTPVLALLLAFSVLPTQAQIYKYQDEHGRWRFTDKKPETKKPVEVVTTQDRSPPGQRRETRSTGETRNLAEALQQRYQPASPVEHATLAVVFVETPLGHGSGFFVNHDGYLITNRHVIRPETSTGWTEIQQQMDKDEAALKQRLDYLDREKSRLASIEENLERARHEVENPGLYHMPIKKEEYERYQRNYRRDKDAYEKNLRETRKLRTEFQERKTSLTRRNANAAIARQFQITLKNGEKILAELIRIAENDDLALLKIDGHTTPFLTFDPAQTPAQGLPVYAIGSPLGEKDAVTAGIITRASEAQLLTDAKILPGNSGGPLIDHQGQLLGVNTQKLMAGQQAGAEGFGIAISAARVRQVFPELFQTATAAVDQKTAN